MKHIVVISGKGGTGKTVLSASFAALAGNAVLADCDVDAANLHLLLDPQVLERHPFSGGATARIDRERCTLCGACRDVCRFGAISEAQGVDPFSCEGCGVCSRVCPTGAITMADNLSGEWFVSTTRCGPLVHARLGIAQENSGKLVTLVKQNAQRIAQQENRDWVIVDGPPGIGCPVMASLAEAELALIVTEPTLSGMHDMERAVALAQQFGIRAGVVVNKYDVNLDNTRRIRRLCQDMQVELLAQLPYSEEVPRSLVAGVPVVELGESRIVGDIAGLWEKIR